MLAMSLVIMLVIIFYYMRIIAYIYASNDSENAEIICFEWFINDKKAYIVSEASTYHSQALLSLLIIG
jgi:hypothetical protein